MKRTLVTLALLPAALSASTALASEAETSASAGSNRYQRDGTASATARYVGDIGSARTQTRSGLINTTRGVAWGLDEDGLSLSVSNAVAPLHGPAVATTFNLSIGRDGRASHSVGSAVSTGPIHRTATAGGRVGTSRYSGRTTAFAAGTSDDFGRVRAVTQSDEYRPRRLAEVLRHRRVRR